MLLLSLTSQQNLKEMICKSYMDMDDMERLEYDAKLLHIVHHSEFYWKAGVGIIQQGEKDGLLQGVKIGREVHQEELPPTLAYRKTNHDEHPSE